MCSGHGSTNPQHVGNTHATDGFVIGQLMQMRDAGDGHGIEGYLKADGKISLKVDEPNGKGFSWDEVRALPEVNVVGQKPASLKDFVQSDDQQNKECSDDCGHEFGEASTCLSSCSMHSESVTSLSSISSSQHPLPFAKHVRFCSPDVNSEHVITPYSQVYGMHPSFFDFDQNGGMQLTDEGVAEKRRRCKCRKLLGACLSALSACCVCVCLCVSCWEDHARRNASRGRRIR